MKQFKDYKDFLKHYGYTKKGQEIYDAGGKKLTKKDKLRLIDYYNMIKNNSKSNSEKDKLETNKALISDGYGFYPKKCPECGRNSMEIVRPGKIQCRYCG